MEELTTVLTATERAFLIRLLEKERESNDDPFGLVAEMINSLLDKLS